MNIKLDKGESFFKQLEYFSMANWKKLEILKIYTNEEDIDIQNIENNFDFPLLR